MQKLIIGFMFAISSPAFAQAPAPAAEAPAMTTPPAPPKMSPDGRKLIDGMLGNWTVKDASFVMGSQEIKGRLTMKCEKAVNGWATVCKSKADFGKALKFDGLYTFAWDIASGEGHMLEVEDSPTVHDHAGKWSNDKTIVLVRTGKNMEGKIETDTVTLTWGSPKEITFAATGKSGGVTNWTFHANMKK
jgi:hypothetical protein